MATLGALGHMSLPLSCTEKHSSSSSRDMFNGMAERKQLLAMGGQNNVHWSVDLKAHSTHMIAKYRDTRTIVFLF